MKTPRPPVIIAGMHRSGTTLLTRMLADLGLFAGWRRESNQEARTFLEINKWILLQTGGAWDYPPPPARLDDPAASEICRRFMTHALNSVWMSFYLGRPWLRRADTPPRFAMAWGWKDPRNTLTLPLWLSIYPDARVIYLDRHGVDVAASLVRRRQARIERMGQRFHRLRHRIWFNLRKRRLETGLGTLDDALALWLDYQQRANDLERSVAPGQWRRLRYETLVSDPAAVMEDLRQWLDLPREPAPATLALPDPGRAWAWRAEPALREFAAAAADALAAGGYAQETCSTVPRGG